MFETGRDYGDGGNGFGYGWNGSSAALSLLTSAGAGLQNPGPQLARGGDGLDLSIHCFHEQTRGGLA